MKMVIGGCVPVDMVLKMLMTYVFISPKQMKQTWTEQGVMAFPGLRTPAAWIEVAGQWTDDYANEPARCMG